MPVEDEFSLVFVCIAKWASMREDFDSLKVEGIIHNWEASLYCRRVKEKILVSWIPPREVVLKFHVDGEARGKLDPAGIGGVLRNHLGVVLAIFSIRWEGWSSMRQRCWLFFKHFNLFLRQSHSFVVVESDSLNSVSWASNPLKAPWRFHLYFSEIKALLLSLRVDFHHVGRLICGWFGT